MKVFNLLIGLFIYISSNAQVALNTINYSYLYNPNSEFSFENKVIKQFNQHTVLFDFQINQATTTSDYSLKFETRKSLSDKTGTPVIDSTQILINTDNKIVGKFIVTNDDSYLVTRVENISKKKVWYFFTFLQRKETFYITKNNIPLIQPFTNTSTSIGFQGDTLNHVTFSFYGDDFPTAAPAFSTGQAKVSKTLRADSIFTLSMGDSFQVNYTGLYLAQSDTSSSIGQAFRVENDYPKLGTLESLAGPLIYVCTKQEFEKIKASNGDKKAFDQVILRITGNTERARNFMRNYFRNVELANKYFTSYKEGWKTDRGMIYIIFGEPQEVYLFGDREIWEYKNGTIKERFQFIKSPTVFDPENYVLIRDKKYTDTWYQVIDLWRKARF